MLYRIADALGQAFVELALFDFRPGHVVLEQQRLAILQPTIRPAGAEAGHAKFFKHAKSLACPCRKVEHQARFTRKRSRPCNRRTVHDELTPVIKPFLHDGGNLRVKDTFPRTVRQRIYIFQQGRQPRHQHSPVFQVQMHGQ